MSLLAVALGAFAVTLLSTPAMIRLARRTGIVDRPGPLKRQEDSIPYLGGVAVFAGLVVGASAGRPILLVPLALAVALGTADDRRELSPWTRLAGELVLGVVVASLVKTHVGGALGPVLVGAATILLVNGVNLMDGLDALAGGVLAVASAAFALVLGGGGRYLAIAAACGLVGFLVYNRPPARIYLGDGGSYLLGTALAVLLAESWAPHVRQPVGVAGLVIVAVPVAEVAFAIVRRVRARSSIFEGDRAHLYDCLVRRGWPPLRASLAYVTMEAVLAGAAVAASIARSLVPVVVVAVGAGAVLTAVSAAGGALVPDRGAQS